MKKQDTSLLSDISARPGRYLGDLRDCAALHFQMGNTAYGLFLGSVAGVTVGPAVAFAIQGGVAAYTAARQVMSTYRGESFGAPFRTQALANWITAATLLATGLTGNAETMSMMALPVMTFSLWGKGHWDVANMLDRIAHLQKTNTSPENIKNDSTVKKYERLYLAEDGIADSTAIFKDKPIGDVVKILSDPLAPAHLTSLAPLPFFLTGVWKTFVKNTPVIGPALGWVEKQAIRILPDFLKSAFNVQNQGITPNHLYASGYALGAALSYANPLFAAAQAGWALGYNRLSNEEKREPVSADEHAARTANRLSKGPA